MSEILSQGDDGFAVAPTEGKADHLRRDGTGLGDSQQRFGQVVEVAAKSPVSVRGASVLMGPLKVTITGCTPGEVWNALPQSCNCVSGTIVPRAGCLGTGPLPLLRVGDTGQCIGVAISKSYPFQPVRVTCAISIGKSLQDVSALAATVGIDSHNEGTRATGQNSENCRFSQNRNPKIKETLKHLRHWIQIARAARLNRAADALERYLDGSGKYFEIPREKVRWARHHSEQQHVRQAVARIHAKYGANGKLAQAITGRAPETWPNVVSFLMRYASGSDGPDAPWYDPANKWDDALEYYGSVIQSIIRVECVRDQLRFRCQIRDWKAYVVDNYDWEGEKQLTILGCPIPYLPSQEEMKALAIEGCARPYQRSSRSWKLSTTEITQALSGSSSQALTADPMSWVFDSGGDTNMIERLAKHRDLEDNLNRKQEKQDEADGALPYPPPAEEMI